MPEKSGVYMPNTEAAAAYDEALQQMLESLERRKNPLFDPTFLAISAGASKPAVSWGQALGNIAESLSAQQERQRKQTQEDAAARLDLASRGLGIEQQRQRDTAFRRMMGLPLEGAAPAAPAPSGGLPGPQRADRLTVSQYGDEAEAFPVPPVGEEMPARGGLPAPPGFEGVQGIQIAPPSKSFIDRNTYLANAMMDPSISPAKAMAEAQKLEKERYETREGGVFDVATGMFYRFPKGELVERQIFGQGEGKFYRMTQETADLLDMYGKLGDPRYFEVADRVLYGPKNVRGKTGEAAGSGKRISSTSESEIEKEARKTAAVETAKTDVAKGESLSNRAGMAIQLREASNDVMSYAKLSPRIFGLLQQPGIVGALKRAAEEGISTGPITLRIPTSVIEQYKLTEDELKLLPLAQQASAKIQVLMRQVERIPGEGTITNLETTMYSALAPLLNDNPTVVRLKGELLNARADFDEKLNELWVNYSEETGKSYRRFQTEPEYKKLVNDYRKTLEKMRDSNIALFSKKSSGGQKKERAPQGDAFAAPMNPPGTNQTNHWLKKREGDR